MSDSNTVFAAEPIEGPLDLGLEEVTQAKRETGIGRGSSIWKTWQKVQASEVQLPWNIVGVEEAKGGLWILKDLGNHPKTMDCIPTAVGSMQSLGQGMGIDVCGGEIPGSRMNG